MTDQIKPALYALHPDEHATVLAALRFYQQQGMGDPFNRSEDIHDLATNGGEVFSSLDDEGIDKLCESINHPGLDFSAVLPLFAELAQHSPYVAAAQRMAKEGEIEVDDPAVVSKGDEDGAYVMGWMWVSNHAAGSDAESEGEEEAPKFRNHYRHCGQEWEDVWSCQCNDRCPVCNKEIEPYESEEATA